MYLCICLSIYAFIYLYLCQVLSSIWNGFKYDLICSDRNCDMLNLTSGFRLLIWTWHFNSFVSPFVDRNQKSSQHDLKHFFFIDVSHSLIINIQGLFELALYNAAFHNAMQLPALQVEHSKGCQAHRTQLKKPNNQRQSRAYH